jgi:glycosyltransferase involved in cell wall biosynthesis
MSVFNKELLLNRSIDSILKQTFSNFELICINAGSNDNSLHILQSYNDYRIKIYSQDNLGISAAKNFGVSVSKYDIIAFLDADDEWDANYLNEIYFLYSNYPTCEAYITAYQCNYDNYNRKVIVKSDKEHGILSDYFNFRLLGWGVHTSSMALLKSIFYEIGGFPVLISNLTNNASYLIDCNGKIIEEVPNIFLSYGSWNIDKLNIIPKHTITLNDKFLIATRGLGSEDQYLNDILAYKYKYAYSKKVLSYWYGNIPYQDTKLPKIPLHPNIIALQKLLIKNDCYDILNYIKYLDPSLITFNYKHTKDFFIVLNTHYYFQRTDLFIFFKNSKYLRQYLILIDFIKRIFKKINLLFKSK